MIITLSAVLFGVFAAAVLRGFTGFGFGLVAVPLLSLALPPAEVVPFVVVLQVVIGVGSIRQVRRDCDWHAVGVLAPGLLLGIPLGLTILTMFQPNTIRLAIGLIIAASVVLLSRGVRLPPHPPRLVGLAVGTLSGTISGLSMMGGPPIVVYLIAVGLSAAKVRASAIMYFMLSGVVAMVSMSVKGLIDQEVLIWSVLSLPVLFVGSWLGTWGFRRARPHHHRNTALVVLSFLSAVLILRALIG